MDKRCETIEVDYSDGEVSFRRPSGGVVYKLTNQSEVGTPNLLMKYNYNSTHSAPPANNQVRTDQSTAEASTKLWIHRSDADTRDNKFFLLQLKSGGRIYIQDSNNSDSRAFYKVLSDPVDGGAYVELSVEVQSFSGTPLAGSGVLIGIM